MPKITDDPIHSYSVGFRQVDVDFIEHAGTGRNLGEKLRSILTQCAEIIGNIANDDNSILAYNETAEGEKIWGKIPFDFNKKQGWQALSQVARTAGYICQVVQDVGTVQVWLAPGRILNNCDACRTRVNAAMRTK